MKLSDMSPAFERRDDLTKSLHHIVGNVNASGLGNIINEIFPCPMKEFSPLPANFETAGDTSLPTPLVVSNFAVQKKLSMLNSTKAQGSDNTPACLLKENADILV